MLRNSVIVDDLEFRKAELAKAKLRQAMYRLDESLIIEDLDREEQKAFKLIYLFEIIFLIVSYFIFR